MQSEFKGASRRRTLAVCAVAILMFSLVIGQLLNLQVRSGEENLEIAERSKMREVSLTGARGSITDRNGLPLAYDMPSYDLEFYRETGTGSPTAKEYTRALLSAIQIVEQGGGSTIDQFAIERDASGNYAFNWRTTNEETAKARKTLWFRNFYLKEIVEDEEVTAQQALEKLVDAYGLEELEWETVRKVLAIWEDWQNKAFLTRPIRLARGLDMATVSQLEARQYDMPGLTVVESTTRIYPRGETAAHIIGYMSTISEASYDQYVGALGYAPDDLVGVSGIERSMEEQLTGNISYRQGSRTVEVNSRNRIMRELSYTPPSNGNNVVLTIDLPLQILAAQALEDAIESAKMEQQTKMEDATPEKKAFYNNTILSRDSGSLNLAATGAVVVMEVNTGKVLAMVSDPGFNPNDFVGGLSTADYQRYFDTENSDYAKLSPMYNRALQTRATPGSIFKMVTGLAGVMEGVVTVNTAIDDEGYYDKHIISGKMPKCWIYPNYHAHAGMTLSSAISNSCNYYFYTVADALGIDRLNSWATRLGLTSRTGIELPNETSSIVGNQSVLYDITKEPSRQSVARTKQAVNVVREELRRLRRDLERDYDDERIERVLAELMALSAQPDVEMGPAARDILMSELGLTNAEVSRVIGNILTQLNDLRWNVNETILTGIGQSITETTPLAVARYISALVNGGTVYEAQIVDRILAPDGSVVTEKEPVVVTQLEGVDEALRVIKNGMRGVVDAEERGTAAKYFDNFAYTNQIGAKTGTAQVNLVDVENNAWLVAFAPFDEPEIAVVVFIANGMSGGYASPAVIEILNYYFESKDTAYTDPRVAPGEWTP